MKGSIQIYTGKGKGKTTAALGRAVQVAGDGLKVFIAQFNKSGDYSEITALERFADLITVEQHGFGRFSNGNPSSEEIEAAKKGLKKVKNIVAAGEHQLVVLDEANVAVKKGFFSVQDLLGVMLAKPAHVELVITGRNASPQIMENADRVIEMQAVKHYYTQGVKARVGIEK